MTRRDYVFLSDACRAALNAATLADGSAGGWHSKGASIVVNVLANRLYAANPRFDKRRFLLDAGVQP